MVRPLDVGDAFDDEPPIIHPDRSIGNTVELVPGNAPGQRGPLKEIVRTRGGDDRAQLLTVTVAGSGVYDSSVVAASGAPRGPLFAVVEWGVGGARAKVELDLPQGGLVLSVVASYVQVAARYDGLVVVNGLQLDPAAAAVPEPGPRQRAGAMIGYGSYGPASRLTRTFRFDNVPPPGSDVDSPAALGARIVVPPFARRVSLAGLGLQGAAFGLRVGTYHSFPTNDVSFGIGEAVRTIDLPGDAAFVEVENLGPVPIVNPALVFEIAI